MDIINIALNRTERTVNGIPYTDKNDRDYLVNIISEQVEKRDEEDLRNQIKAASSEAAQS